MFQVTKNRPHNKNYMSIGVSVRTTKFAACNNGIGTSRHCPSFERSGNGLFGSVYREGVNCT